MKRLFITFFLLAIGAALGGGGFYVATHWEHLNPFRDKSKDQAQSLLTQLRRACATDAALKGAYVKSAEPAFNRLALRGFVADKNQIPVLEKMCQEALETSLELKTKCENGVSADGLKTLVVLNRLSALQGDLEAGKGADTDVVKHDVMRTTRLDAMALNEDGKLVFSGVSIRAAGNPAATKELLLAILKSLLEQSVIPADLMPELALDFKHHANPAVAMQKKIEQDERGKEIRLTSAWYDAKGTLHVEGLAANAEQRKLIDEAVDALVKSPDSPTVKVVARIEIFDDKTHTPTLQKKLVEYARKLNKPNLQRVRLANVSATFLANDPAAPDGEGVPHSQLAYEVKGRLLDTMGDRQQTEIELIRWLAGELPSLRNPNQTPILPKLNLIVGTNPVFAMQERMFQRRLDGAVFTDARYDEQGRLELFGRLNQPGEESKGILEAAVKDLLADEAPWTLKTLKSHEANQGATPIAWNDVLRDCRAILASDRAAGARTRLDRLYFRYTKDRLRLLADGIFLIDQLGETPSAAITKSVDAVILSRSNAEVSPGEMKNLKNPLGDLQNMLAERRDLDGAVLTHARFDPNSRLLLDGFLGSANHKAALTLLLAERLKALPDLLTQTIDPKAAPGWSIDGMSIHPPADGNRQWPDVMRACQAGLGDAPFQRVCLERAYFRYVDGKSSRQLTLHCQTIHLVKPAEKIDEPALTQKLAALGKRLLPDLVIERTEIEPRSTLSPIYELQKIAEANRHDGLLFQEAAYDRDGKLTFSGVRGSEEQLKVLQTMIDKTMENKMIAPFGVAGFERFRLIPWQPLLAGTRAQFADDPSPVLKQTRVDRVYFQHDAQGKAIVHVQGISIYHGKTFDTEKESATLTDRLQKHLAGQGVEAFPLTLAGIERKQNPTLEMQKQAVDTGIDGVVFHAIGFDAKGICYVALPFIPKGQEANIQKLLDGAAKKHAYLGAIQQR